MYNSFFQARNLSALRRFLINALLSEGIVHDRYKDLCYDVFSPTNVALWSTLRKPALSNRAAKSSLIELCSVTRLSQSTSVPFCHRTRHVISERTQCWNKYSSNGWLSATVIPSKWVVYYSLTKRAFFWVAGWILITGWTEAILSACFACIPSNSS